MSTPKPRVSSGTIITPPPSLVREPRNPAINEPIPTRAVSSSVFILRLPGTTRRTTSFCWESLDYENVSDLPAGAQGSRGDSQALENARGAHSATNAHGNHAVARTETLEFADQCGR